MHVAQDFLSHSCFSSVKDSCGYFVLHLNLKYKHKQNVHVVEMAYLLICCGIIFILFGSI